MYLFQRVGEDVCTCEYGSCVYLHPHPQKYLGQYKSSVVKVLFPYRKQNKFLFYEEIERLSLYLSMLFDRSALNIRIKIPCEELFLLEAG